MTREEKKKQREAVQFAWRILLRAAEKGDEVAQKAAGYLVAAFPEYLGPS